MKKFLFALAALLFLSLIPCIHADKTDEKDVELENWKQVINVKGKEIAHFKELSNIICATMYEKLKALTKSKDETDLKLDQLRFDLITGSTSPYDYRQVLREICYVAYDFQSLLSSDSDDVAILSNYLDMITEAKESVKDLMEAKNISPEVIASLDKMDSDMSEIHAKFLYYRDAMKAGISQTSTYAGVSFDHPDKFNEVVFAQLKTFYLNPSSYFFSKSAWMMSKYLRQDWFNNLRIKIKQNFPDNQNEFTVLSICLVGGIIVFLIFNLLINKRSKLDKKKLKPFKESLLWFIMALVFIVYNYSVAFMPKNSIVLALAILFLIRSVMFLGWGLRVRKHDELDSFATPFAPLFWLYVYGVVLQFTDQYMVVLSALWILGLLVFSFFTHRHLRKIFLSFEKILLSISMVLGVICIFLVLVGMVYTSIIIMMGWFLICLGIQLARHINYSFNGIVQYIEGNYVVLKILLIGLSVPILWLFIILMIFMWGIGQIFGTYFFVTFINTNLNLYGYTLNFGNIAFAVYLFFVFKTISNVVKLTIKRLSESSKIESGAAPSITILVTYALWTVCIIVMLKLIGVSMTSFAVISGGLSVGIGFGLRDILNNFVSGIIILGSHSIRHGDIIEVGGITGKVIEITIRSTVVKTGDNAIVCIPNSTIISDKLINWTNQDLIVRKGISVGVAYGSDIDKVKAILIRIANEAEYVLSKPAPSVSFDNFGDNSIALTLVVWISDIAFAGSALSTMRERIYSDFIKNSIEMPFPQMDVHMIAPPEPKKV